MSSFVTDYDKLIEQLPQPPLRLLMPPLNEPTPEYIEAMRKNEVFWGLHEGCMSYNNCDFQGAIRTFSRVVDLDPSCTLAFVVRAIAYEAAFEHDRACQDYERAIRLDGDCAMAFLGRSEVNLAVNKTQPALADCTKAITLAPRLCIPRKVLGDIKLTLGDVSGALTEYNAALKLATSKRESASVLVSRGLVHYSRGAWRKASRDIEVALNDCLRPLCQIRFLLWVCQARCGRNHRHNRALERYVSRPESPSESFDTQWLLTLLRLLLGKTTATEVLSMAKTDNDCGTRDRLLEAHFLLGSLALLRGDKEESVIHFEECVSSQLTHSLEYVCARAELARIRKSPHLLERKWTRFLPFGCSRSS